MPGRPGATWSVVDVATPIELPVHKRLGSNHLTISRPSCSVTRAAAALPQRPPWIGIVVGARFPLCPARAHVPYPARHLASLAHLAPWAFPF